MFFEILIGIIAIVPAALLLFVPFIGIALFPIAVAYIVGRLSLVFPSIAIGASLDLGSSWDATKNHQLMMFVVVILFPLSLRGLEYSIALIPGMAVIVGIISILTTVFVVAALSVAYKIIMGPEIVR